MARLQQYLDPQHLVRLEVWGRIQKEEEILKWIYRHDYWSRLWIIQEVALAKRLRVFIGEISWPWEEFLLHLRTLERRGNYNIQQYGYRIRTLDEKRKNKHGESNTLEKLLEDFQYAKCQEPKDKIYGLLGLAHDCEDGSVEADYSKQLYEIHHDVVKYFISRRPDSNRIPSPADRAMRIVGFSELVQHQLGPFVYPAVSSPPDEDKFNSTIVRAAGSIGGKVLHLGPSFSEIISTNVANKTWRSCFPTYYPLSDDIRILRTANEKYMELLLKLETREISEKFPAIDANMMFSKAFPGNKSSWISDEDEWKDRFMPDDQINRPPEKSDFVPARSAHPDSSLAEPRMFLGTNYHLGLVSQGARVGDFICHFWETEVTALLRKVEGTETFHVVGRMALHVQDDKAQWNQPRDMADILLIDMDIRTLSFLAR